MARAGDVLEHPVTGERIVWRQVARDSGGRLLQGDLFVQPGGFVAAEHVHPNQEERFEVIAGTLRLRVDGEERLLGPGDVGVVPAGRRHAWWNVGADEVHVVGDFRPALRTEDFFETMFGLASEGKTNRKGLPNPLQLAVLMREYEDELRLARPSPGLQKVLFGPLAVAGRLLGYRGSYSRYASRNVAEP
jgi:quercetin dioxygenase-like cupin family protein